MENSNEPKSTNGAEGGILSKLTRLTIAASPLSNTSSFENDGESSATRHQHEDHIDLPQPESESIQHVDHQKEDSWKGKAVSGDPLEDCTIHLRETPNIRPALDDHRWHCLSVPNEDGSYELYRLALCLRLDGRLLFMGIDQFRDWIRDQDGRKRLDDMSKACGEQLDHENIDKKHELSCPSCVDIHFPPMGDNGSIDTQNQVKEFPPKQTSNSLISHEQGGLEDTERYQETSHRIIQACNVHPPCYCLFCSYLLWTPRGEKFAYSVELGEATEMAKRWVSNILEKRQSLVALLEKNENTIRRKWEKKNPKQRRILLEKVCPELPTYKLFAAIMGDRWPTQKPRRSNTEVSEPQAYLMSLNVDDLVDDPNLLFDHLQNRTHAHPSQFFFSDFLRLRSIVSLTDGLEPIYAVGTFDVTEVDYGKWHVWEDSSIHNFQRVAAPFSMTVFKAQSCMLDSLWDIASALLPDPPVMCAKTARQHPSTETMVDEQFSPSIHDVGSLFMNASVPTFTIEQVMVHTLKQSRRADDEVELVRTDNSIFVERIKFCTAFQDALGVRWKSQRSILAYNVFVHPYDRAIAWKLIHGQVDRLLRAHKIRSIAPEIYSTAHTTLLCMLENRFKILCKTLIELCTHPSKQEALVPREFLGKEHFTVVTWVGMYFMHALYTGQHIVSSAFIRKCLDEKAGEVRYINDVIREWCEEAIVIRRVVEMLMCIEPTILNHAMEPIDGGMDLTFFRIFPEVKDTSMAVWIADVGHKLEGFLEPVKKYALPRGPRNGDWVDKDASVRKALKETWRACNEVLETRYTHEDSNELWVEMVSRLTNPPSLDEEDEEEEEEERLIPGTNQRVTQASLESDDGAAWLNYTSIPHHVGPETPATRRLTKKKREDLNATTDVQEDEGGANLPDEHAVPDPAPEDIDPVVITIPIKKSNLEVAEAFFSNSPAKVTAVRWARFLNFMEDAGTEVRSGEGSAYTFTARNVVNGQRAAISVHKPHSVSTLRPEHFRVAGPKMKDAFGWEESMFVARH